MKICEKCKAIDDEMEITDELQLGYDPSKCWKVFFDIQLCPDCFKIVWRNFVMEAK